MWWRTTHQFRSSKMNTLWIGYDDHPVPFPERTLVFRHLTSSIHGDNMTSKLDCRPHCLETDSAVFSKPTTSEPVPSRLAPAASFVLSTGTRATSGEFMNAGRSIHNISSPFLLNWNEWKHPKYANFTERYASFRDWPKFLKGPNKKDLARAGFIYTEIGDRVTCFSCGLSLKDWEPFDDSYKEHFRWSKNCVYANMVSDGKDYWVKYVVTLFLHPC